jgi:DNA-binding transcriptional regulator YiaG
MFHYTSCGLRNVWLRNGYRTKRTSYGKAVAIEDIEGLHRAIARYVIAFNRHLSGAEFRYLRKELGLSQASLAELLGNEEQTVALWERRGRVPVTADRVLRALYREHADGNAKLWEMIERLNELEATRLTRVTFEETNRGWVIKEAA